MKTVIYEGGRWLAVLCLVIWIITAGLSHKISDAVPEDVRDAVIAVLETDNMEEADAKMVKRLYGIDPAAYEGCFLYSPVSNMDAEELLIVKMKDPADADALTAAAEARVETQKKSFEGYGISQYDLLTNHCVIETAGNYMLFVVNRNADAAKAAFLAAL